MTDKIHPKYRWNALSHARLAEMADIKPADAHAISFGYIAPINYLNYIPHKSTFHLCLAHLCTNETYCEFYRAKRERGDLIFMDNSAFELGEGIENERLLDLIDESGIKPHVIVAPDFPGRPAVKTLNALVKFRTSIENRNYKEDVRIMGVPQSEIGKHDQWIMCYNEMTSNGIADTIGMSILALPNAFCQLTGTTDISHNRLYGSLYLRRMGLYRTSMWHHYLGAGSPSEIQLIPQLQMADSMDSSSPIWHGIHNIKYDESPTGLINGKIKKHVDFELPASEWFREKYSIGEAIDHNVGYIDKAINPPIYGTTR